MGNTVTTARVFRNHVISQTDFTNESTLSKAKHLKQIGLAAKS